MTQTRLYLTNIQCHKLQNIVGQGCASPYQVLISESDYLGIAGQVAGLGTSQASNQDFEFTADHSHPSLLQRALRTIGFGKG